MMECYAHFVKNRICDPIPHCFTSMWIILHILSEQSVKWTACTCTVIKLLNVVFVSQRLFYSCALFNGVIQGTLNSFILTSLNFNYAYPYLDIQQFVSTIKEGETERVWFGSVWFGLVWGNIHLKLLWKFHQDLTWFGGFREELELVW